MEYKNAFLSKWEFKLSGEDLHPIATTCMHIVHDIYFKIDPEASNILNNSVFFRFDELQELIFDSEKKGLTHVTLNYITKHGLIYVISTSFEFLDFIFQNSLNNKIIPKDENTLKNILWIIEHKEKVIDLMIRITESCDFCDYGMDMLKSVFNTDIGKPNLAVDDEKTFYLLEINEKNLVFLQWSFDILRYMSNWTGTYKYADNFKGSKYFNYFDYDSLKTKLSRMRVGQKKSLTLKNTIILYYSIYLTSKIFKSDGIKFIEMIENRMNEKRMNGKRVEKGDVSFINGRDIFLKTNKSFLLKLKKQCAQNPIFDHYIKDTKKWKF